MTEFRVGENYGKGIELGIAVPGFDANKWTEANKYWFDLTPEEAKDLIQKLEAVLGDDKN